MAEVQPSLQEIKAAKQNNLLYTRLDEAVRMAIEKCSNDQRMTKDNFDRIYKELYDEAWRNFEFLRSKI